MKGVSALFLAPAEPATKFVDNINVVITVNPESLKSTIAQTKRALPSVLAHYRVVIDEPATADGRQAHLLVGTFDGDDGGHLENLQLYVLVAGKQYTVTFTSPAARFGALRKQAQASLLSFHLA